MSLRPFFIDCDTGRDDALTLWLAAALGLPLLGAVTSYGNATLDQVVENTSRVLSLVHKNDLLLFRGASRPSRDHKLYHSVVLPRHQAVGNGLCNIELPFSTRDNPPIEGVDVLAQTFSALAKEKGPLDYIVIGPATNLAALLDVLGETAKDVIASVTMMGGKFGLLWDADQVPDFNVASDPFAVHTALHSGVPMRFLPLNETWPIEIDLCDLEKLVPENEVGQWAKDIMVAHCTYFATQPVFKFHDPSILLAAILPESFEEKVLEVCLDEADPAFGRVYEVDGGVSSMVCRLPPAKRGLFLSMILKELGLSFQIN